MPVHLRILRTFLSFWNFFWKVGSKKARFSPFIMKKFLGTQKSEVCMSKKKTVYDGITAWMSAKADNKEKRFIQVGNSLLLSKEFQKLGVGARCLYMCMAMESAGKRGFEFPLSSAKKYGFGNSTLRRYIAELEEAKFITVNSMKNVRRPNEYAFSLEWKGIQPLRPPKKNTK